MSAVSEVEMDDLLPFLGIVKKAARKPQTRKRYRCSVYAVLQMISGRIEAIHNNF